jgi:hypothetical protein
MVCQSQSCVQAQRVFVTSGTYNGDLNDTTGADSMCQQIAQSVGLGGTWLAWISDSDTSPLSRFTQYSYQYCLVDGTQVAADWTGLTSGSLENNGINLDQQGNAVTGSVYVWTATNPDGSLAAAACNDFVTADSTAPPATVGIAGNTDGTWTAYGTTQTCDGSNHLYCVEQ